MKKNDHITSGKLMAFCFKYSKPPNYMQGFPDKQGMAEYFGVSENTLGRKLKGTRADSYVGAKNMVRLDVCKKLLRKGLTNIEIAPLVDLNDSTSVTRLFSKMEGKTPNQWKKQRG